MVRRRSKAGLIPNCWGVSDIVRQVADVDQLVPARDNETLDDVLHLAHVARPVVLAEPLHRLARNTANGAVPVHAVAAAVAFGAEPLLPLAAAPVNRRKK